MAMIEAKPAKLDLSKIWVTATDLPQANIVAAGPLTKQRLAMWSRVVLLFWPNKNGFGGEFSVHTQCFENISNDLISSLSEFSNGDYFRESEFAKASERFSRRVHEGSKFLNSLYVETPAQES